MTFGILLGIIGTLFEEINNSITKQKTQKISIYKMGAITSFFGLLIFLLTGFIKIIFLDISINFNPDSIYLLILRLFLEILQSTFTIYAIKYCDRSTFSIIRILTIPLLLLADIFLGYNFNTYSIVGILFIMFSFFFFNLRLKVLDFKGWYLALFTAVNALFTLSLFKYSISEYGNSVEVDQFFILFGLTIYFILCYYKKEKKFALLGLKEKIFIYQGVSIAIATLFLSFSIFYINASEATTIKRTGEMLWSIIFGKFVFKENHFKSKLIFSLFLIIGIIIMML